ncbi:MAG: acetate--CoA ligase family protein [Acidobacteria bacterium]|nr:acetate--CoA ligase family protein [Acidobacteriota bacterium]
MAQLHEFQAKKILAAQGIEIPRGAVAFSPHEAREIAGSVGGEVVVKAQIHSTSRAAAGGIRFAESAAAAESIAAELLGTKIAGNVCQSVLIDEKATIEREFYLGFIIDSVLKRPTLLFSASGGSGIEDRADSMQKLICSIRAEPTIREIRQFIEEAAGEHRNQMADILLRLYRAAKSCEARTAEINPLAILEDGRSVALDARISVDDYAVFRHEDLGIEMARELGHTPTKLERIAWNIEKDDFRGTFYFVEIEQSKIQHLKSKIGFHGAGGGGSMASLDAAQRNGLAPACYVDTSGNPPASKVYRAARIILSIPGIKGYFLSGSGVASQEQFGLARAVVKAFLEVRPTVPAVLRLGGNGEDIAKEIVERFAGQLPATIEAYRKQDTADFCAARLHHLIGIAESKRTKEKSAPTAAKGDFTPTYEFKTKTGRIAFDYSKLDAKASEAIVESCPQRILALENGLPVLAIEREDAERGKCSECLACEFAGLDLGLNAVKIDFPIDGLSSKS